MIEKMAPNLLTGDDYEVNDFYFDLRKKIDNSLNSYKYNDAMIAIKESIDFINQQIEIIKPWEVYKNDPDKCQEQLNNLASKLLSVAVVLKPFLPETSQKILDIYLGQSILKPEPLFARIETK